MTALRVLLVSEDIPHPHLGGLGKHAVVLGNALIEAGHHVDLLGNSYWPAAFAPGDVAFKGKLICGLNTEGALWKEPQLGFYNYYRRAFLARRFAQAILRIAHRYDAIHYHGHLPILANYIPDSLNFVQTRHDQGGDCLAFTRFKEGVVCSRAEAAACATCLRANPNPVQRHLSARAVRAWRAAVRRAHQRHAWIYVSRFVLGNLERTLGPLAGPRVKVVHNFVDARVLESALDAQGVESSPDVFMACRIDRAKGVSAFLGAAAHHAGGAREITVAGDGPDLKDIQGAEHGGLRVSFLGWTAYQDVVRLTASARAVVVPSVCEESCGTTILEALALGRPVFALARGGNPELRQFERFPGQLQLFGDMDALAAAALTEVPDQPVLDRRVGLEADVSRMRPAIEALYRREI